MTEPGTAAAQPKLWVFTRVQGEDEGEGAGSRSRLQEGNNAWSAAGVMPPQPAKKLLRSRAPNPTSVQSATGSGRTDEEEAAARGRRLQIWRRRAAGDPSTRRPHPPPTRRPRGRVDAALNSGELRPPPGRRHPHQQRPPPQTLGPSPSGVAIGGRAGDPAPVSGGGEGRNREGEEADGEVGAPESPSRGRREGTGRGNRCRIF